MQLQRITKHTKNAELRPTWHVVDAEGERLGRLASRVANLLQGKHRPNYSRHQNTGDFVIVVNAAKVGTSGRKLTQKVYYRHTGYLGHMRTRTLEEMLEKFPERVVEKAVKGMLPRNRLGHAMLRRLKVYRAETHPHEAQVNAGLGKLRQAVSTTTRTRSRRRVAAPEASATGASATQAPAAAAAAAVAEAGRVDVEDGEARAAAQAAEVEAAEPALSEAETTEAPAAEAQTKAAEAPPQAEAPEAPTAEARAAEAAPEDEAVETPAAETEAADEATTGSPEEETRTAQVQDITEAVAGEAPEGTEDAGEKN